MKVFRLVLTAPIATTLCMFTTPLTASSEDAPVSVSIRQTGDRFELLRDGQPYYIRGAGAEDRLAEIAAAGGNSVRTWGSEQTERVLDEAARLGLTVAAGLWIEHERHGFDYSDDAAVEAQIRRHCAAVDRFKDHPALLMWGVGNEVSIAMTQPRVWEVIEAVAKYIQEVDPHHPVMTVFPHVSEAEVAAVRAHCPSIDLLGFNCYAGIDVIGRDARARGWDGPFLIAEWGPDGNWEVDTTDWGAEIEPTTTAKAFIRATRYARIQEDPHCLGSYVFYWGQKQETTPTWFNLFLENGAAVEGVEVMQYLWTGGFPAERAPRISPLRLNGTPAEASLTVTPGEPVVAEFALWRAETEDVTIRWELLRESTDKRSGGDLEQRPAAVPLATDSAHPTELRFSAPEAPGVYRLFLSVETPARRAAAANFPFRVAGAE